MNILTILAILGILATVLFGVWGVYVIIRRRYPGQITLIVDDCIGLFDTIVKNFPDLSVLYQEKPVSHGLVLFKGTFLNSGKKDITPEMVENKITLELPEDFKWLAAKTITSSPNVQSSVEIDSNSLLLSTGLFRCQEYFKFEALAEVPVSDKDESIKANLLSEIKPTHRIADTGKIRKLLLPPEVYTKLRIFKRIIPLCILLLVGFFLFGSIFFKGYPAKLHFQIPQQDGSVAEVTAKPLIDGRIHIRSKTHDIDDKVEAKVFFARSDIRPKIVPDSFAKYVIVLSIITYIILPIIILSVTLGEKRKWRRLRKQIGMEKSLPNSANSVDAKKQRG